jgi:hypothetical protein
MIMNYNDTTLLELAAKAAGIDLGEYWSPYLEEIQNQHWNPLRNDGQALRLAVKLGIRVPTEWEHEKMERCGLDVYEATRRVIVRAAAEIGESM